jgi:hypothetical protein
MNLLELQRILVARIDSRPIGSWSRFKLMDAADAISLAIDAEAKEGGAEAPIHVGGNQPQTQSQRAPDAGAGAGGNQS